MYRGFQLNLKGRFREGRRSISEFIERLKEYEDQGEDMNEENESIVQDTLDDFFLPDSSIDGSKMQENWFPQIEADVFISHSHQDEELALGLAGWLYKEFGLKAFIDSVVWGYANDLLRKIDDKYCYQKTTETYSYQKRNYSTSHIHMMLSVALTQMIDNTECLFFLNTPNSLSPNPDGNQTESPWIYSEISISQLIRKKNLRHYRMEALMESQRTFSAGEGGQLKIRYDLNTEHLTEIGVDVLKTWDESWSSLGSSNPNYPQYSKDLRVHALDKLYELTRQKNGQQ